MENRIEECKAIVARYFDAMSRGDLAEDFIWSGSDPGGIGVATGLSALKAAIGSFIETFPDFRVRPLEMIGENDKVATHLVCSGHHEGAPLFGVNPTDKYVDGQAYAIYTISDGKVASESFLDDSVGIMTAQGVEVPGA